jgi:2,4-didehydro-3-deoxy-L-rhamnonate hydrolase
MMATFRLATIEQDGRGRSSLVVGDRLFPLADLAPDRPELHGGLFELLQRWDEVWPTLESLAEGADPHRGGLAPDDRSVRVLTPIRYPRGVYCTVFNYYDFAAEVGAPRPNKSTIRPYVCTKLANCVVGPDEAIVLPDHSARVDWEVELGVVIGRRCRGVLARDALDYVAGYTIVNDLSARDGPREDWPQFGYDWLLSKGFDTSAPIGPYLLPSAFVADPHRLRLRLSRNGELMQDGSTASMIFSIEEQIEFLGSFLTLLPGDVIATGTPAGIGWPRGIFLQPGDELVCVVEGIGTLRNPVVGPVMMAPPGGTAFA